MSHTPSTRDIHAEIDTAIANSNLTGALGKFSESYALSRVKAYEGVDFEGIRTAIGQSRGYVVEHLDEVVATFKKNAEARGTKVFVAHSPDEARDYITKLALEKGVTSIVKSKSMATEEIHLNDHLAKHGIKAEETDLGEWIIQLAGQRPSHMVLPAIHLTKEDVAGIFSKEVNERLSTDIPRLVKIARGQLREKYFKAQMGISGANIAIAETGSIVLVTNEGNARLVTALPNIHVALVGLEKLVPSYTDAAPILVALPKSATSQQITSYVSIITGPTPNDDGTMKDLHIVLMDNRRSEMAKDEKFKQAFNCIRCASCLNVCPVYRLVGGHVFGDVYTGGIGTILTAWFNELEASADIQGLCIQCGKCKEVCPGGIDIPGLILEVRHRLADKRGLPFIQKTALKVINNRPLFHTMLKAGFLGQKLFEKEGYIRHLPMFLSGLAEHRSLPTIAKESFRDQFAKIEQPKSELKAAFFAGCATDFVFPQIGEAMIKVLNKAGIEVVFPEGQSCCGVPHWASGAFDMAAEAAATNVKVFTECKADYVVTGCSSCATALKKEWSHVLKDTGKLELVPQAEAIAAKTFIFSELVVKLIEEQRLIPKDGQTAQSFTHHDSCHAKRHCGVAKQPRQALQAVGMELKEMYECDTCCGMGGSYTLKEPAISMRMLERKLQNIADTKADFVSVECPGCLIQIGGGLDKTEAPTKARHVAELLVDKFQ